MGEQGFTQNAMVKAVGEALTEQGRMAAEHRITTAGGRFQVRRDENDRASALGQLAFFAEFLEVTGVFERWQRLTIHLRNRIQTNTIRHGENFSAL